jgi:lysophospholipase L1-like esterase
VRILCVGDSLTRAQISADYVSILQRALPTCVITREGVNLELSSGLVARLDPLVREKRDAVCVLTGTSNVRYSPERADAARLRRRWRLTGPQILETYREDLKTITSRLKATGARVRFFLCRSLAKCWSQNPFGEPRITARSFRSGRGTKRLLSALA